MERARHYQTATRNQLTPRQREVLDLIACGKTNGEIAETLGITLDGAKFHVREILAKLGVESREEAAAWWRREHSMRAGLQRLAAWISAAGVVKPIGMAAAAAGTFVVAGIVAGALFLSQGGGDLRAAETANPTNCDPNVVKWRTDGDRDADGVMRFSVTVASFECILDTDIILRAWGMTDEGAGTGLWMAGAPVKLHVGPMMLGTDEQEVIRGSVANVCNRADRLMLIFDHPEPEQFVIDRAYLPLCTDVESGATFSAALAD